MPCGRNRRRGQPVGRGVFSALQNIAWLPHKDCSAHQSVQSLVCCPFGPPCYDKNTNTIQNIKTKVNSYFRRASQTKGDHFTPDQYGSQKEVEGKSFHPKGGNRECNRDPR